MASPATARIASLQPDDWIRAAFSRLSELGIEAVRVEVLARELGVSKGSFYWHFRDRNDLLEKILTRWEDAELGSLDFAMGNPTAAARWARFLQRTTNPGLIGVEVAIRAWARRDERVAHRVAVVERRKAEVIVDVLRDVGFTQSAAEAWSEVAMLACLGWLDRATRDREFRLAGRSLGEFLSELILAASSRSPAPSS